MTTESYNAIMRRPATKQMTKRRGFHLVASMKLLWLSMTFNNLLFSENR